MAIAYYAVIVVHVLACLFLIAVVLLQQGKSQDLANAFGGGGTQTAFGPRGSANVLSRATTVLAAVFMITNIALSILRPRPSSILDQVPTPAASASPAGPGAALPMTSPAPGGSAPAATTPPASTPAAPASAPAAPASPASR
jgi:preprotein translocase subunit SecG